MKRLLTTIAISAVLCNTASAEMYGDQYRNAKKIGGAMYQMVKNMIGGTGQGFLYANADLVSSNRPPLYCQPESLTLNEDNYVQILEKYLPRIEAAMKDQKIAIGQVLLYGLKQTFPCGKSP